MFNAILSLCRVENWNWLRLNVGGFPEAFTEKHSPQTAHNLLQDEVARAEDQSEVISKSFAAFIYIQKLFVCLFFSVPTHPVSKDNKMQVNFDMLFF